MITLKILLLDSNTLIILLTFLETRSHFVVQADLELAHAASDPASGS